MDVSELLLRAVGDTSDAQRALEAIRANLESLNTADAEPHIQLRVTKLMAQLEAIEVRLRQLDGKDIELDLKVRKGLVSELNLISSRVGTLGEYFKNLENNNPFGGGGGITDDIATFGSQIGRIGIVLQFMAGIILGFLIPALAALGASFVSAAAGAGAIVTAFLGALGPALVLIMGLVSRISAVMGAKQAQDQAAASATRGTANAAKQAAAAHEREYQALIAIRDANQAVIRARRAYTQAVQEAKDAISEAAKQEADAHRKTIEAVRDYSNAQRDLTRARKEASGAIDEARQKLRDESRDLKRSRQEAGAAIATANQEIADSYRKLAEEAVKADEDQIKATKALRDARLDLRDAQLDLADAQDRVKDLQQEINDLLTQAGAIDPTEALRKLQDVDLDPEFMKGFLESINVQPDTDSVEKLQDKLRELEHAKLDQEKATNRLTDSEDNLVASQNRVAQYASQGRMAYEGYKSATEAVSAAQENLKKVQDQTIISVGDQKRQYDEAAKALKVLQDQGIAGAPGVISAQESLRNASNRVAEARRAENDAEEKLNRLRQQGIAGAPGVIAASDGIRDANQRLAQARHQAAEAARKEAEDTGAGAGAAALAAQKVAKLSDAERGLLGAIREVATAFRTAMQPATDAVIGGLTTGIHNIIPLLRSLSPFFTQLGQVWGDNIVRISNLMAGQWAPYLQQLIQGTTQLSAIAGPMFTTLMTILLRIATAAMPWLVAGARALLGIFRGWEVGTRNTQALQGTIAGLMGHLASWLKFMGSILNVLMAFIPIGASFGKNIVDNLTKAMNATADWLRSAEGMHTVRQFMQDMIPVAGELVKMVILVGGVLLAAFRSAAPVLSPVITALNGVLGFVMKLLVHFPILGQIITALVVGFGIFKGAIIALRVVFMALNAVMSLSPWGIVLRLAIAAAALIIANWKTIGPIFEAIWNWIKNTAITVWNAISGFLMGVWNGIRAAAGAFFGFIKTMAEYGFLGPIGLIITHWGAVSGFLSGVWGAIRGAAVAVWNAIKTAIETPIGIVVRLLELWWTGVKTTLSTIWHGIKSAASTVWEGVKSVIWGPAKWVADKVGDLWEAEKRGLSNIWNGIKSVASTVWGFVRDNIWNPIKQAAGWVGDKFETVKRTLGGIWDNIKGAASNAWGRIKDAVTGPVESALRWVKGIANDFFDAGKNIIDMIGRGIEKAFNFVVDKAKGLGRAIRNVFPFSEPQDPQSPLRGLAEAGRAIVKNVAAGLRAAGPELLDAIPTTQIQAAFAATVPPTRQMAGSPAQSVMYDQTFNIPPAAEGGQPDPIQTASLLALAMRQRGIG